MDYQRWGIAMLYTSKVECHEPLWPDLAAWNGRTWARRDAALLGLAKAVYEAMHGVSLLDRPVAVRLAKWVNRVELEGAPKKGATVENSSAGFTFSLKCEA